MTLGFLSISTVAQTQVGVWEVLRQQFSLSHETNRNEVQEQIRWLLSHPTYLQNAAIQAQPYIYYIIHEIKKRKLPGELALLPMIESAYNPFAYSDKGAAGLWQLMPLTANDLGLKQDWWLDNRRSITLSTDAALNYLVYLNKLLNGNWILTIAAYDAGIGAVSRALHSGKEKYFWSLLLPKESMIYVPRFLALAELMQNPKRYQLNLPQIPYLPYFEEVNVNSQIDLSRAAKLANMSYREFIKLNPGYNRWATPPYKPFRLLIPKESVRNFNLNLANIPEEKRVSWIKYRTRNGDKLANIANLHHTTISLIKQLNQLKTNELREGQMILIPSTINSPLRIMPQSSSPLKPKLLETTNLRLIHIVQPHETYQRLSQHYGVSAKEIQVWNHLSAAKPLYSGQQLLIWKGLKDIKTAKF